MGFLQTLKNKLGIGGVKVELVIPAQVAKKSELISGKLILTTKSVQEIREITVSLKELYSTGRGEDQKSKEYLLGKLRIPGGFSVHPDEVRELPFELHFQMIKSENDEMRERGGTFGALGSMGAFADNEKSVFTVDAQVDVKSATLDPMAEKKIKLV